MNVRPPFFVHKHGPALRIGDTEVVLIDMQYGDRDSASFLFEVEGGYSFVDTSLRSGVNGFTNTVSIFESMLTFLSAAGEAWNHKERTGHYSDNLELFPAYMCEWAGDNLSAIDLMSIEVERGGASLLPDDDCHY